MSKSNPTRDHVTIWDVLRRNVRQPAATARRSPALEQLAHRPVAVILRHLDCGSCGACDEELAALSSPVYDVEQYGIAFRSSPLHAHYLAMTGPLTRGLARPAALTLDVMPEPRIIAVGDCAAGCGPFATGYAIAPRPDDVERAIVLRIPGCPPSPAEILEALAAWLQR
jgi:Ni,Fe-hydrogenase III small subunit